MVHLPRHCPWAPSHTSYRHHLQPLCFFIYFVSSLKLRWIVYTVWVFSGVFTGGGPSGHDPTLFVKIFKKIGNTPPFGFLKKFGGNTPPLGFLENFAKQYSPLWILGNVRRQYSPLWILGKFLRSNTPPFGFFKDVCPSWSTLSWPSVWWWELVDFYEIIEQLRRMLMDGPATWGLRMSNFYWRSKKSWNLFQTTAT
jgi:hypothetical protein